MSAAGFLAPLDAVSLAPGTEHVEAALGMTKAMHHTPQPAMFKRNPKL
jgi:hypothetical protein